MLGLIFSSLAGMIAASVVNGLNTYLFKDYFGDVKVMSISGMLNTVYAIITFIGTKYVSKKLGKKEWCMYCLLYTSVCLYSSSACGSRTCSICDCSK